MTGPNPRNAIIIFVLINIFALLTFGFPMVYYAIEGNALILAIGLLAHIIVDVSMVMTCLIDPGILPKYPGEEVDIESLDKGLYTVHKAWFMKLKYCYT